MRFHLAQVNVARTKAGFADPAMAGLTSRVAEMNALAERSPGFIWRYPPPADDPGFLEPFREYCGAEELSRVFFNMSVWESVESLHAYVFRTAHRQMLWGKEQWIEPGQRPPLALWWSPAGHRPSVAEARERLAILEAAGPAVEAFTFSRVFAAPE